ncbi:MAG TPA: PAAR domain-containing protein [Polyangia bacterium]|nr:PAAR domain-containing protein [Polyangia bacterium]
MAMVPLDVHGCPSCPHQAMGPAVSGSPNVFINGRPALRVGDSGLHAACCQNNSFITQTGSQTVLINGQYAHRMGDITTHCGGIGCLITGSFDVIVGGPMAIGGLQALGIQVLETIAGQLLDLADALALPAIVASRVMTIAKDLARALVRTLRPLGNAAEVAARSATLLRIHKLLDQIMEAAGRLTRAALQQSKALRRAAKLGKPLVELCRPGK